MAKRYQLFHLPKRLDISELCILGLSCAIFLRCKRDHTMNAFIGRLICSSFWRFVVFCIIRLKKTSLRMKIRGMTRLYYADK